MKRHSLSAAQAPAARSQHFLFFSKPLITNGIFLKFWPFPNPGLLKLCAILEPDIGSILSIEYLAARSARGALPFFAHQPRPYPKCLILMLIPSLARMLSIWPPIATPQVSRSTRKWGQTRTQTQKVEKQRRAVAQRRGTPVSVLKNCPSTPASHTVRSAFSSVLVTARAGAVRLSHSTFIFF
jgi:hypothetical protein